jgi:hypothetical protein
MAHEDMTTGNFAQKTRNECLRHGKTFTARNAWPSRRCQPQKQLDE